MNHTPSYIRQRGMTLVELMVGLAIGLVVSLAAAALYLATNETSRATKGLSDINETGKLALDMIGRELEKAGFFPAEFPNANPQNRLLPSFFNGKIGARPIFNSGVYGCTGARYITTLGEQRCDASDASAPDSIIINYFATPEFGATSALGNANDCNRQPVSNDVDNTARAAANQPLFVSNRFILFATQYTDPDGRSIDTKSLACHGNGNDAATTFEPHLQGITDMVILYGVYASTGSSQSPAQFFKASDMAADAWSRVTAVKICLLVQSLENAHTEEKTGKQSAYQDCRGGTVPPTDHYVYKRFERVFAIRNNLTVTL